MTLPPSAESIRANLRAVRERMAAAQERSGRGGAEVRLVAVTKYAGPAEIRVLLQEGVRDLGENRLQIAWPKVEELREDVSAAGARWRFIGHLQTNKVRQVLRGFQTVDAVDSQRLLESLAREAPLRGPAPLPCLVEVNISGESQKHGLARGELEGFLRRAAGEPACEIQGLMTLAPFADLPEATSRPVFAALRGLLEEANAGCWYRKPLRELSMGMTQDFEIAIEEGATMIRVGSALFTS